MKRNCEERYNGILDYWKNRSPFKDEGDIPTIPVVSSEDYADIIVPNIIRCGGIPKKELVIGETYIGDCRNSNEAEWNGNKFVYQRTKFGFTYPEEINHFEDDDGNDLFIPIKIKN